MRINTYKYIQTIPWYVIIQYSLTSKGVRNSRRMFKISQYIVYYLRIYTRVTFKSIAFIKDNNKVAVDLELPNSLVE